MRFQKYVTREPVTVEAFRFDWDKIGFTRALLPVDAVRPLNPEMKRDKFLMIVTPLGSKELHVGDYLMKSQYDHWYPVNGSQFDLLYRPMPEEEKDLTPRLPDSTPESL